MNSKLPPQVLRALFCAFTFAACSQPESAADDYAPSNRRDGSASDRDGAAPGDDSGAPCSKDVDCMGVCGGSAVVDSCGVCNGNDASKDCAGVCGGSAKLDCSDVCNGPNVPAPYYVDADGDGLGDPKRRVELCAPAMGNVTNADDCDDGAAGKCKPSLQLRFKRKQAGSAATPYTKSTMAGLGDVDGDGVADFAVGERIVFMNRDGSIKGGRTIVPADFPGVSDIQTATFGSSVAALGDVDGNGVPDIAIAEPKNAADARPYGVPVMGRVWTLLLNRTGAPIARVARQFSVPASVTDPALYACRYVSWGSSLASLDLNGDGKLELAVASSSDCDGSRYTIGRIELFSVATTGVLTSLGKITANDGVPYTRAELDVATIASAGDANGDGTADLFVATPGPSYNPVAKLWTLLLKPNGTLLEVASRLSAGDTGDTKLSTLKRALVGLPELANAPTRNVLLSLPGLTTSGGLVAAEATDDKPAYRLFYPRELGAAPAAGDEFGAAAASLGDLDGDGLPELSVLAPKDDQGGADRGALYTLGFAADCSNQTLRGDCNASAADGCETTLTTNDHCGACGQSCTGAPNSTGGSCSAEGKCVLECDANFGDCNGDPRDGCETNLQTDANHCNRCGNACLVVNHRLPSCAAGVCGSQTTCEGIWNDCDSNLASNGCESCGKCTQKTNIEQNYGAPEGTIPAAAPCAPDQVCQQEFYRENSSALSPPTYGRCLTRCPLGRADCDGNTANGCEANITLQSRCGGCGANNICGVWEYLEYCVVNAAGTNYECR